MMLNSTDVGELPQPFSRCRIVAIGWRLQQPDEPLPRLLLYQRPTLVSLSKWRMPTRLSKSCSASTGAVTAF